MPGSSFLECWVLSKLFHSLLSPSSKDSLVLLAFCHKSGVICISEIMDTSPGSLVPAGTSFSLAFHMTYSAYKLNKQGDNIQPWCTPFPIWNVCCSMSVLTCFLTCIQISQQAGKFVWYSHFFKHFSQFVVIYTVKDFRIVNEAEVMFLCDSLAFSMTQWMLAIWSLVPLRFLNPAEHLKVLGSCNVEGWLGEFWALLC